jgi:predicted Zn-dependent protease
VNSAEPWPYNGYQVVLLDSPEINAFAGPGGHILITRGLTALAPSEDGLAAVIAHELAHIQLNHGIEFLEEARLAGEMRALGTASAGRAYRVVSLEDRLRLFAGSVTGLVDDLVQNGYSRAQEMEADLRALSLLASAGYAPAALGLVLRLLDQKIPPGPSRYTTTHPSPGERLRNLAGELGKYQVQDTRSYRQARFRAVMAGER